MFSCLYSLYNQVLVLNLISSQGYVFHFLEQFFTLVVLSLLGHGGRGALAAGCIGLSLCFLFINLLTGFQQTLPHFLRKEKRHKTWLIAALFLNLIVCILYLATIFLLSLVLFPFIPLKNSVLQRAVWFAILLSPYLFVSGVRSLCIQHHDFMNRTRPIIVASIISSASAFVGTMVLVFSYPMGLTGCAVLMSISQALSTMFLLASTGKTSQYKKALRVAVHKVFEPCDGLCTKISMLKARRSSKVGISPDDANEEVELTALRSNDDESTNVLHRKRAKPTSTREYNASDNNNDSSDEEEEEDMQDLLPKDRSRHDTDDDQQETTAVLSAFVKSVLRLAFSGFPSAVVSVAESSWYLVSPFVISTMGSSAVDAFFVQQSVIRCLIWATIYPLSVATSIQLRAYLKTGHPDKCASLVWLSFFQSSLFGGLFGLAFYVGQEYVWYWFTANANILHRCGDSALFTASYVVCYAWVIWAHGILRGFGDISSFVMLVFLANWVIGCPLGVYLGIFSRPIYNLTGYWIAWLTSGGLAAVSLVAYCLFMISWKRKHAKMVHRHQQEPLSTTTSNPLQRRTPLSLYEDDDIDMDDGVARESNLHQLSDVTLFRDGANLSIYGGGLGGFILEVTTLEDDLIDIEIEMTIDA